MTTIEFRDVQADQIVGSVDVTPQGLRPRGVAGFAYVEGWTGTPASFAERYRDWSNGYIASRARDGEAPTSAQLS